MFYLKLEMMTYCIETFNLTLVGLENGYKKHIIYDLKKKQPVKYCTPMFYDAGIARRMASQSKGGQHRLKVIKIDESVRLT